MVTNLLAEGNDDVPYKEGKSSDYGIEMRTAGGQMDPKGYVLPLRALSCVCMNSNKGVWLIDQPLGVGMMDVLHPLYSGGHVTTTYTWMKRERREARRWSIGILTLRNLWIYDAWGLRVGTKEHCPIDRQFVFHLSISSASHPALSGRFALATDLQLSRRPGWVWSMDIRLQWGAGYA